MKRVTNELCLKPDCENLPISLSNYCGEHTDNELYFKRLQQYFTKNDKVSNGDVSLMEIKSKNLWSIESKVLRNINLIDVAIQNLAFNQVIFEHCFFEEVSIEECVFKDCQFINCQFRQLDFIDCKILNSTFKECEWSNTNFHEDIILFHNEFHFDLFENCYFATSKGSRKNYFNNVSFRMCSFIEAYLEESHFYGAIFSKNSIAKSSFRHSIFEHCENDFDYEGLVVASDFYKVLLDERITRVLKDKFCNFDKADYLSHSHDCIAHLVALNHPNHIDELAYYLSYVEDSGYDLSLYQEDVINLFKKLYQIAVTDDNYAMIGHLMQSFMNMPESIRQQNFLLPNRQNYNDEIESKKLFTLTITIDNGDLLTLNKVLEIVNFMLQLEYDLYGKNTFELLSAKKGSAILEIFGSANRLIVFAGVIFMHAPDVIFQILRGAKNGLEIEKLRLHNKLDKNYLKDERQVDLEKKKLEIEKIKRNMDFDEEEKSLKLELLRLEIEEKRLLVSERKQKFMTSISQNEDIDVELNAIEEQLNEFQELESRDKLIDFDAKLKILNVSLNIKSE